MACTVNIDVIDNGSGFRESPRGCELPAACVLCFMSFRRVSSCAEPSGRSGRRPCDTAHTHRAFDPCASCSDASARPSGRISSCSPPTSSGKVFLLTNNKNSSVDEERGQ